ncbi:MAG: S8 family serine peptidase [Sphingobacteriales bacterium]|nr:S8 family serine peptidase [Sphingobacteriales bacterium]
MPFSEQCSSQKLYRSVFFLLLLVTTTIYAQKQPLIRLRSGNKMAETNLQSEKIKTHLRKSSFNNQSFTIVQFNKLPDANALSNLQQAGIKLLQYIPDNAYWISMPSSFESHKLASLGVRGVYEPTTADKSGKSLYNAWQSATINKTNNYVSVNISCLNAGNKEELKKELRAAGAIILNAEFEDQNIFQAKISTGDIEKITAIPYVYFIEKAADKSTPLLYITNATHNVYALTSTIGAARGLSGSGVTVGVGDETDANAHIDFSDRLINRNANTYYNLAPPPTYTEHSTAVVGIIAGAGNVYETYRGIAPKSTVVNQYFYNIITNAPGYITDYNMPLTNNSYYTGESGCTGDGDYDVYSQYADNQLMTYNQLLHVFAAGNDGALSCSAYPTGYATIKSGWQCAKNILSVANGIGNRQLVTPGTKSSRGPVNDGRIKPEITAAGNDVRTTAPVNTYTRAFGTSFASPAVVGVSTLLVERYKQLNGNVNPKGSLLKALLCNSADDLGNPGPDYTYGFGWMNAKKAVEDMEAGQYLFGNVTTSQTNTHNITVPANASKLKVMLYWNDPAANPAAATSLVNDLDLTVSDGSTTYQPWVLDPSPGGVTNNAVRNADHLNNIEQVTIDNPAAGTYTVNVNGFAIPQGPQEYVMTYDVITNGIELEYPNGGEKFLTDSTETIFWNASDGGTDQFTLEYSINNGSTWNVISNTIPATDNLYRWTYTGLTPTDQALMRISRNNTALTDQSNNKFTILGLPTNFGITKMCDGYVRLSWTAVASATDYEVFKKSGNDMVSIGTTNATSFDIDGLSTSQAYWFAVRARINGAAGRRCVALSVTPSGGSCTLSNFDNDLKLTAITSPVTGRKNTSSALSNTQSIKISVKNLDNAVSSNTYTVSYRVNGGSIVTETPGTTISASGSLSYTFTATYDFSATGTYNIEAWVNQAGDTRNNNDSAALTVKQLLNDPVTLPFTEGFETAAPATYTTATTGLNGLDDCDFFGNNTNSRARTFVNTGFSHSGTRAVTLDATTNFLVTTQSNLITTVNLSTYTASTGLRLTLYYRDHQQVTTGSNNFIWIRGDDTKPWIQAYNLNQTDITDGSYIYIRYINVSQLLSNAGQTVSSSFQIRFGEQGITSANNSSYAANAEDVDDGYTFDDVTLSIASNDVAMEQITYPARFNCGLTNATSITVSITNTSAAGLNNVPVSYRINGGSIITETIASLPANSTSSYTFTTTADLSTPATYTIDAWVKNPTDDFAPNDSVTNYSVTNNFTVTTFPYYEGFENSPGYWYTQPGTSSWEWGTPAKTIINKAANGTKIWTTNLDGNYKNNELSYLYSPCFDLTSLTNPVLSFSHIFRTEDDCDCDYHWIEYSTDGTSWQKLGTAGQGTNWFDNATYDRWQISRTYWIVSSIDIPVTGSAVRFRFVFSSDPFVNYEGVGIDDIQVFEKAAIYTGPENPKEVIQNVSGNGWIHFDYLGNRIASINPRGQNLGSTSVKVFINDTTSVRYRNNQYYLDRNIVVQPANLPDSAVLVRFYFTDQESEFLLSAAGCPLCSKPVSAYDLGVTKYSYAPQENGLLDDNTTGNYSYITPANTDILPYDNGYYAEYSVTSFSEFWLNDGGPGQNKPLPLQLLSFSVHRQDNTSVAEWETAAEINIEKFIIERKTNAGFVAIGEVMATGSNSIYTKYSFVDNKPGAGSNYYRIKIIEKNGAISYSDIRKIDFSTKSQLQVYPNPVSTGKVTIASEEIIETISINDARGALITSYPVNKKQFVLSTAKLAKGVYWLKIQTAVETRTEKLICQ